MISVDLKKSSIMSSLLILHLAVAIDYREYFGNSSANQVLLGTIIVPHNIHDIVPISFAFCEFLAACLDFWKVL